MTIIQIKTVEEIAIARIAFKDATTINLTVANDDIYDKRTDEPNDSITWDVITGYVADGYTITIEAPELDAEEVKYAMAFEAAKRNPWAVNTGKISARR